MRDKIAGYLERSGRALTAVQILREVLNIQSPNTFAAEKVLRGILGQDARFQHQRGMWRLKAQPALHAIETASLDLQSSLTHPQSFRGAVQNSEGCTSWEFQCAGPLRRRDLGPLREARLRIDDRLLLVWSRRELRLWNRLLRLAGLPEWEGVTLEVNRLAARVITPPTPWRALEDIAPALGLASPDADSSSARVRFLAEAGRILLDRVPAERRSSMTDLARWLDAGRPRIDFSRFAFGREFLARIPESAGVYLMRDRAGEVIYVGKSANLRRRVRSYFTVRAASDPKAARIHNQLYSLETMTCATEVDALLLEMRMIRDFRPAINLQERVHEKPAGYGQVRNLLLLAPAGDRAEIYFLKDGAFAARQSVPLGSAPARKLRDRIRRLYFATARRKGARAEKWETEIVARWVSANRKRLNFIDVEEAGTHDAVICRLTSYLTDPDRLSRKVYYR